MSYSHKNRAFRELYEYIPLLLEEEVEEAEYEKWPNTRTYAFT